MSEHAPKRHEAHNAHENLVSHEHQAHVEKQRQAAAEHARKQAKSAEQVAELHKLVEQHAKSKEDIHADRLDEPVKDTYVGTQKQIKEQAYQQTLRTAQRKLPKASRRFSKVIHNDVVNAVSEVGAKTVARPSGLLGGSMVAFFGSVVFLYYARHYGFRYNYLVLFILFVFGFVVGAFIELLVWAVYSRRRHFE
jgi:hypothetical protein